MQKKICRHGHEEFDLRPGKPGLIDECALPTCRPAKDVNLIGGNMIYLHKTAPYIEIKSMDAAQSFASQTARGFGGVTRSIVQSRELPLKEDEGAEHGAIYYSRLGEKRSVKGGSQQ